MDRLFSALSIRVIAPTTDISDYRYLVSRVNTKNEIVKTIFLRIIV